MSILEDASELKKRDPKGMHRYLEELPAQLAQLAFALGLLLDRPLLQFQLGFAAQAMGLLLGLLDDLLGFRFRVAAAKAVEPLDDNKRPDDSQRGDNEIGYSWIHSNDPRLYRSKRVSCPGSGWEDALGDRAVSHLWRSGRRPEEP